MKPLHIALALMMGSMAGCAATNSSTQADLRVASAADEAPAASDAQDASSGEANAARAGTAGDDDAIGTASSGESGGGIMFSVNYRVSGDRVCSRDRATGSHFEETHCRSQEAAREERDAAQEFLKDRMRKSR